MKIRHAARYQSARKLADRVQVLDASGWRRANAGEMASLCTESVGSADGDVSVIAIPKHLLKRWWKLAESGDGDLTNIGPGFESYAREVAEYFNYKNWPLPSDAVMEVVVSGGEDRASGADDAFALQSSRATRFSGGVGMTLACINLGDEELAIVLDAESGRIRVILEAGEGVMLPERGVLWNRMTIGSSDLAVTLTIGTLSTD